jgi:nucleoside 2-deoxyribosyltransferase
MLSATTTIPPLGVTSRGELLSESPLRVYLAARYSRLPELRRYRAQLEELGMEVTSRWLHGDHQLPDGAEDAELAGRLASEDLLDIDAADAAVVFGEAPRCATRGGRNVEAGYALGRHKAVIWVGPREHVFSWHPWVRRCDDWTEAVRALMAIAAERVWTSLPAVHSDRRLRGGWA